MKAKSDILITISLVYFSFCQSWAQSDTEKTAISNAQAWLYLLYIMLCAKRLVTVTAVHQI